MINRGPFTKYSVNNSVPLYLGLGKDVLVFKFVVPIYGCIYSL